MDENVAKAVERLDNAVMFKAPNADYDAYRAIRACLVELEAENERLRMERNHERAKNDRLIRILTGIHAVLYPGPYEVGGKVFVFRPPNPHEWVQAISDRIRAIPDEITAHLSENSRG